MWINDAHTVRMSVVYCQSAVTVQSLCSYDAVTVQSLCSHCTATSQPVHMSAHMPIYMPIQTSVPRPQAKDAASCGAACMGKTACANRTEHHTCAPVWHPSGPLASAYCTCTISGPSVRFFSISRSMPTANPEDPLFRSEGRPKDAPPPRPFRCYPPTRSSPRAFAVGTRRKVAKNRSTLRPCTPDIAPKVCSERLQGSKWARCVLCMRGCMCVAYMLLVRCTHVVHMLHPCCASVAGMLRVCCRYVARVLLAFCIHVCCRYVAGHACCMHVVYTLQACMLRACCIYVASMLGAAAPAETSTMPRVATRCARRIQRARRGYMPSLICHN